MAGIPWYQNLFHFTLLMCISTIFSVMAQVNCPNQNDYSPCTCSGGNTLTPSITCNQISMQNVAAIFARTEPVDAPIRFLLTPTVTDVVVPMNLLGSKFAFSITIRCPAPTYKLQVDPEAFSSSRQYATSFSINTCDLVNLDLSFLTGFTNLTILGVMSSSNIQSTFPTLPYPLPSLNTLNLYNNQGWNELTSFPLALANGLIKIDVGSSGIEDDACNRILDWVTKSSNKTLEILYMDSNNLKNIPQQIPSLKALNDLHLEYNQITSVKTGELQFTAPVKYLAVDHNQIPTIQQGALQGNFSMAYVTFASNQLTRFESSVFQVVLEQMFATNVGMLYLSGNPFDCTSDSCHLAWALRTNRNFLNRLELSIKCSNGTSFKDLDPKGYESCDVASSTDAVQTTIEPETTATHAIEVSTIKTNTMQTTTKKRTNCPNEDDYSPCTCSGGATSSPSITCNQIPIETVKQIFTQTEAVTVPINLDLRLAATDQVLPANVMGNNKYAGSITIRCPSTSYKLQVVQNAFRTSSQYAARVFIGQCDLGQLDLSFLSSFNNLTSISLATSINLQLALKTLPYPLPSLNSVNLYFTRGLNETVDFPVLSNGLNDIDLGSSGIGDSAASRIFDWLVGSSNTTLSKMHLDGNALSQVPSQIPLMTGLVYLDLSSNQIRTLRTGDLRFTSQSVTNVYLRANGITTVQSNAFQGNFSNAVVHLQNNNLTRFEASAFRPILQQMATEGANGYLYITGNSFDCSSDLCHMSWIGNTDRKLLSRLDSAQCSNGTLFKDLQSTAYDYCASPNTDATPPTFFVTTRTSESVSSSEPIGTPSSTVTYSTPTLSSTISRTSASSIVSSVPSTTEEKTSTTLESTLPSSNETTSVSTTKSSPILTSTITETNAPSTTRPNQSSTIITTWPAGPQGQYAAGICQTFYYQKSNGFIYNVSCPIGLVFNPSKFYCDWRSNVAGC